MANEEFSFASFTEEWLGRQKYFLEQLRSADSANELELKALIREVRDHYQEFCDAKRRAAEQDVHALFCPPWLSTFERTCLWVTGFNPNLPFRVIERAVDDLSDDQQAALGMLKHMVKWKERELWNEAAMAQEIMASNRKVVEAERASWRGTDEAVDGAMEMAGERMRTVVNRADYFRMWVATNAMNFLTPSQCVVALAAAARYFINISAVGKARDARRVRP